MNNKITFSFRSAGFGRIDYLVHGHPDIGRVVVRVARSDYAIANKLACPDEAAFYAEQDAEIGEIKTVHGIPLPDDLRQAFKEYAQATDFDWRGITLR